MRGRQIFMDSLRLHGVEKIFGNPGTTENPLLDSLLDYPDIDYVVALHEGVAVSAASFYAQAANSIKSAFTGGNYRRPARYPYAHALAAAISRSRIYGRAGG